MVNCFLRVESDFFVHFAGKELPSFQFVVELPPPSAFLWLLILREGEGESDKLVVRGRVALTVYFPVGNIVTGERRNNR